MINKSILPLVFVCSTLLGPTIKDIYRFMEVHKNNATTVGSELNNNQPNMQIDLNDTSSDGDSSCVSYDDTDEIGQIPGEIIRDFVKFAWRTNMPAYGIEFGIKVLKKIQSNNSLNNYTTLSNYCADEVRLAPDLKIQGLNSKADDYAYEVKYISDLMAQDSSWQAAYKALSKMYQVKVKIYMRKQSILNGHARSSSSSS